MGGAMRAMSRSVLKGTCANCSKPTRKISSLFWTKASYPCTSSGWNLATSARIAWGEPVYSNVAPSSKRTR